MTKVLVSGVAALAIAAIALFLIPGWPLAALQLKPDMAQAAGSMIGLATIALIERARGV